MQPLVARNTGHPYDRVIGSISRCDPRRAAAGLTHAPSEGYGGRICRRNFIGPDRAGIVMKPDIRSLTGMVRDS